MSETLTIEQFKQLKKSSPNLGRKQGNGNKAKAEMELVLKLMDLKYECEYLFHPTRKWRFDWAIPYVKVAVEYEGVFGGGKSRHTTVKGYTGDAEKYNEAAKLGWKILRYTAKNYRNLTKDLRELLPSGQAMYCFGCGKLLIKQDCACPKCGSLKFETAIP